MNAKFSLQQMSDSLIIITTVRNSSYRKVMFWQVGFTPLSGQTPPWRTVRILLECILVIIIIIIVS